MDDKLQLEIEAFAHKILFRYFCEADVSFLISTFASDIVWMGGGEKMKAEGKQAVAAAFLGGQGDLIPCDMTDEDYVIRDLGGGCYLCQGDSWIRTKRETESVLSTHQRITFIFRRIENGRLETVHIHNSVPYAGVADDELFPMQQAKEAYEKLRWDLSDRDQQIELMLSQLPGGTQICQIDHDFSTKWISNGLCQMLGYGSPEDYRLGTGNACLGFIEAEDYEAMWTQVMKELKQGGSYAVEYRAHRKNGDVFWVSDLGKRVCDPDGEPVIYCFISDITERKTRELQVLQAKQEVEQQARFLTQLYNTVPCGILQFTTDPSHTIVSLNRMVWEYYGFTSEAEYRSCIRSPFELVLDGDYERIRQSVDALTLGGETASHTREVVRRDGIHRWIDVKMDRLINADGLEVIQAAFNDITEIRAIQQAREQEQVLENRSLRAAICTAYPLIMSLNLTKNSYNCFIDDQDTYTVRRQGEYDRMVCESAKLVYPSYREDFTERFSRENILREFQRGKREIYMELRQVGIDGNYHWIAVHIIHVDNPYNDDVYAIDLVKTLDEQRSEKARQEQLLRDALAAARAANSAKSDFLSRMSHDIRTPMNAIIGMSAIGQLKAGDPNRMIDCFQKIDASSRYLLSLINDILDMSKIENGKMTLAHSRFDLTELLGEINAILFPQAQDVGITFEMTHKEPVERLYWGDALRLKQILMNLLSNAFKFTPKGGAVQVDLREERRANGFSRLRFTVSDTGIGMSEAFMQRIFQPFEQEAAGAARNNVGSGLGLSIVFNLVQLMGGEISVQSAKGKGSTFTTVIPFELAQDDEEAERVRKSKTLLEGIEVLVVDDDPFIGEQTAEILGDIGAHSQWVGSGMLAVEAVRASLERGRPYDIAMIDWKMPDMDGIETTRRIRALTGPDTTIIIISAYDWSSIEGEAREAGANCFIAKPLFRSTVRDTIGQLDLGERCDERVERTRFAGERVLLVEDNELNLEIAQSLLEIHGLAVDACENGLLAVEAFRKAPKDHYFAILMDIRMPVMDGLGATRAIRGLAREDAATVPILAMTANAFDEDRQNALEAGMDGYLVKPLEIELLLQELEKLGRRKPLAEQT